MNDATRDMGIAFRLLRTRAGRKFGGRKLESKRDAVSYKYWSSGLNLHIFQKLKSRNFS